ncbi:hypothetical protein AK812_SmicGene7344 [Symbiodinium microadriaticum]|uniref:Uncharacterized protein n=1 Tax=Symbiodinium microadriaticum TaxID=2951 RepID=A0A1Q9EP41_SYMMI|nr:hypothetical protein AK812_SmicGene7344 [Symbiodinium microadriaticum]|mmetsp:Transcript_17090/g.40452  ORF Transcript_17090/g.40452 Transcript_17090/m.40452 type:complete len:166 (-) Transcript_17090:97-594(-)|eukprot:CAMPEP_0181417684 /NCGR_PEP_ID=MMETSP1110-20121109/11168_1 /TAXON_ID=174948 /ORGANISM="Symbiodinium sp., Strain CCMP421" /LENGTH=165 /DNA_ID=CAMNT_0023540643 /DNA_START=27 /DNA_END=524 /DNA_ORIENTATION=-
MGTVSSGLTDGFSRATCCVQRRAAARCLNPHLNVQLLKWEHEGAKIEEVWLIRDSSPAPDLVPQLSSEPSDARLAIVYNISVGSSGLKPLRLDWKPEGLGFMQGGLSKECLCVKVPASPLPLEMLISHLQGIEKKEYDPQHFNSQDFCKHLYGLVQGKEERSDKE